MLESPYIFWVSREERTRQQDGGATKKRPESLTQTRRQESHPASPQGRGVRHEGAGAGGVAVLTAFEEQAPGHQQALGQLRFKAGIRQLR